MCKRIIWLSIATVVLILDQISKWIITDMVFNAPDRFTPIEITSFFNIVIAWNTGVSFSLFSNSGEYMPYILIVVALAIATMFGVWLWKAKEHMFGICYALIIGGALGNIVDRARFGAVVDFLDFHALGYHWPAFNVADMAVVVGITMLIIFSLFFEKSAK